MFQCCFIVKENVEFPPAMRYFRKLYHRPALCRPLPPVNGNYSRKQDEQQVRHTFTKLLQQTRAFHVRPGFTQVSHSDHFKHGYFYLTTNTFVASMFTYLQSQNDVNTLELVQNKQSGLFSDIYSSSSWFRFR